MNSFCFTLYLAWSLVGSLILPDPHRNSALTAAQAIQSATAWTYQRTVEAGGNVVHKATIGSPTVLDLGYPYGRGAVATLTLRHKAGSTSVYIEVAKGQLNRSFQDGTARVGFDGQRVRRYALTAAANGRANIVFVAADPSFIASLKRAKRMTVELVFAGQANRRVAFSTAGLRWPH